MGLGCFVSVGRSLDQAIGRVKLAEELGYEAGYVTHINARESLTVLTAYAGVTERIRLGTGVVPVYTRTPEGEKWQTGFLLGMAPRPDVPILVAGLSPRMLQLAGEIADGVVLWLCNPRYVEEVVVPEVRKGRERAGKSMSGFDVVAAVPAACVDDPAHAFAAMRRDLLPYFGLPFYRAMIERSGFGGDIAAFDGAAGDADAMQAAISEDFLRALTAVGSAEDVRAGVGRYHAAGATSPCVGPIARTDFEGTLRAAIA